MTIHKNIAPVPRSAYSFLIKDSFVYHKKILAICSDEQEIELIKEQLHVLLPQAKVVIFPAWDTVAYDKTSPYLKIQAERIFFLANINAFPIIALTTHKALFQKIPNLNIIKQNALNIKINDDYERDELIKKLLEIGYNRTSIAIDVGDIAVRGGIIDIVTIQGAYRIDFFGNTVDTIKEFNPESQSTISKIKELEIYPASEVILDDEASQRFKNQYRVLFGAVNKANHLFEAVSNGQKCPGYEQYLPLYYESLDTIFDYIKDYTILSFTESRSDYNLHRAHCEDYYKMRKDLVRQDESPFYPMPIESLYFELSDYEFNLRNLKQINFSVFDDSSKKDSSDIKAYNFMPNMLSNIRNIYETISKSEGRLVIACESKGSMEKIKDILTMKELNVSTIDSWNEIRKSSRNYITLFILPLDSGFMYQDLIIASEQNLLGQKIRKKKANKTINKDNLLKELSNFLEGELVVHRDFGIGKFVGLEVVKVTGIDHDCLKILYHGGDRFYLPVENIDMLSRYGNEEGVDLDKLGGAGWQSRKAKLKERIKLQAEAILKIAAERELRGGAHLSPPQGLFDEFCARFPYPETDDQLSAVDDIINDLSNGKSMDRLICGDVGFGKTEVAMRAAFTAVLGGGMQVAVVVPTTLLSRQHFKNFSERFAGLPVRVKQLSRLVSAKDTKLIKEQIEKGAVDIIVGTHALLAKDINFKNLGMIIIDEEQHFGVIQKERLKELKANIHVLTLTATPIPRTLHMALSGIRELSIIATPPVDRHAVKTYVMQFDPLLIREAILNEKARGGKVFYVVPRISDLPSIEEKLKELVPDVKYAIANGRMPITKLENVMNDFYDGNYDLLLATTIVESGLDVPSANTIIIHRSDMFGLSQLYQLRGRVGRGKTRAFAYLTVPNDKILTPQANRRLEVMQQLDSLGSGFMLANYDMDIRGMGNLLGDEQSGHIKEVGVELYQDMLTEEINKLKNCHIGDVVCEEQEKYSPQINIGLSVLIPEEYIPDMPIRLGIYRRIAELKDKEELDQLYAELIDRFGEMPDSVKNLFLIIDLKQKSLKHNIAKIDAGPKGIVFGFYQDLPKYPDRLMKLVLQNPTRYKLRNDHKFIIMAELNNINDIESALSEVMDS